MIAACNLSLVPVRREPSDKSEMVSQLLFGELVEITGEQNSWIQIRMLYDDYRGWVDKKQLVPVADEQLDKIKTSPSILSCDLVQLAFWNKNQICPVVIGSNLQLYNNKSFFTGKTEYTFEGNVIDGSIRRPERILDFAYMFLNSPYLWGGRSPFGIDCSGFTQMVFKLCGIFLPRDSAQQAEQGVTVNSVNEAKEGDLAFFENNEGRISHVGIILPGNYIIHASGKVRIDVIDKDGIFIESAKSHSHNLRLIKRI